MIRTASPARLGRGFGFSGSTLGLDAVFGLPQCGHAIASEDMSAPHSEHLIRAIYA